MTMKMILRDVFQAASKAKDAIAEAGFDVSDIEEAAAPHFCVLTITRGDKEHYLQVGKTDEGQIAYVLEVGSGVQYNRETWSPELVSAEMHFDTIEELVDQVKKL